MGELGLRLHDFYNMPWYEFTLKRFAYYRERSHSEKERWYNTRFIAHRVAISPHAKPNPMWFTKDGLEKFLPIDTDKKAVARVSDEKRTSHLKEYEEYLKQKNSKK